MADSLALLNAAIYSRLGTATYTYTTAGTAQYSGTLGAYDTLAPQQSSPPYVVFSLQSSLDDYAFAGDREESFDILVKAVSLKAYPSHEAVPVYDKAHTLLQDAPLSVAGYSVLRVRRTSRVRYRDNSAFWHNGGLYRIDIAKD